MAFQTLNINGRIHMNPRVMNENGREGWTEKTYQDKNLDKGNHYDFARSSRNFELIKGCHPRFLNDPRHVPIEQRLNERLKKLGFNYYKEDSKNAPYSCVDIIVGGDHDRMNEIGSNFFSILSWAEDNYKFFCKKFGEDNIISFCVHLDETTPHAHVLAIPTAIKKQRGRVKSGEQRKVKEVVSFKAHFGDLSKANSRKAAFQKWHDDYYQAVGKKWGFERGRDLDSMSPEERAQHRHLHKNDLDMRNRLRAENKALEEQKNQLNNEVEAQQKKLDESEKKLQKIEATVLAKENDTKSLDIEISKKRMQYNSLADSVLEIKQDATKRVIDDMIRIRYSLQELKKTPEQQKKNRQIVQLASCLYLRFPKKAQQILNEVNGQKVVFPAQQEDDRKTRIACLQQAEKLINLPKIEQEQERGFRFGR